MTPDSRQTEVRVGPESARAMADYITAFIGLERQIIAHREDKDPAELQRLVEAWAGMAEHISRGRRRLNSEILTATVTDR